MFKLKSFVLSGLFLCLFTCALFAQDNTASVDKAKQLINLVKMDQMLDQQIEASIQQLTKQMPEFENHKEELYNLFNEMLNKDEYTKFVTKLLADNFTEAEIEELIKFYKSPIGQKTLSKMPVITQESIVYMHEMMNKNKDKFLELIQKVTTEQQQKNQAQPPAKK